MSDLHQLKVGAVQTFVKCGGAELSRHACGEENYMICGECQNELVFDDRWSVLLAESRSSVASRALASCISAPCCRAKKKKVY